MKLLFSGVPFFTGDYSFLLEERFELFGCIFNTLENILKIRKNNPNGTTKYLHYNSLSVLKG